MHHHLRCAPGCWNLCRWVLCLFILGDLATANMAPISLDDLLAETLMGAQIQKAQIAQLAGMNSTATPELHTGRVTEVCYKRQRSSPTWVRAVSPSFRFIIGARKQRAKTS